MILLKLTQSSIDLTLRVLSQYSEAEVKAINQRIFAQIEREFPAKNLVQRI